MANVTPVVYVPAAVLMGINHVAAATAVVEPDAALHPTASPVAAPAPAPTHTLTLSNRHAPTAYNHHASTPNAPHTAAGNQTAWWQPPHLT